MPKKNQYSKKLGRDEVLSAEDMRKRFLELKRFLGDNWGRIGLKLQKARKPDDIRNALRLVPSVEWCIPFRDSGVKCLISDGSTKVGWRELRLTREACDEADRVVDSLWSGYHDTARKEQDATNAVKAEISRSAGAIQYFPCFLFITLVARELELPQAIDRWNKVQAALKQAQTNQKQLRELLSTQEGWFARNEVLSFVGNKRFEKTVVNFAKAMAGLPVYGWLYSLRKCSGILTKEENAPPTSPMYQLFEFTAKAVRRVRPINMKKIEAMLLKELQREETDLFVKAYVGPNWAYVQQSLKECKGKRFKRSELPYKIMERVTYNFERSKTITELELAKKVQLSV